jgi:hypothetical protein
MAGTSLPVIWTIPVKKKPNGVQQSHLADANLKGKGAVMERNFLLLIDADADTASAVMEAAAGTHLDLRFARTSNDAFHLFDGGLDDVAVIVLDVDPGGARHGGAGSARRVGSGAAGNCNFKPRRSSP